MYLVDTDVVSEARRDAAEAVAWLRSVNPLDVHLSVITLGEIMRGIALKQKSDPRASSHLAQWPQTLRRNHADRILPVTDQIAVQWGRIDALRPRGDADGLIAATAISLSSRETSEISRRHAHPSSIPGVWNDSLAL